MTSLSTILRDLVRTTVHAVGRATRGVRPGSRNHIRMPDLATVEDIRAPGSDPPANTPQGPDGAHGSSDPDRDRRRIAGDHDGVHDPGQVGPAATVPARPLDLEVVGTAWVPDLDGEPDPGEVVWTWVPYEEADGRGKDRPVLVVARVSDGSVLAVPLSSRDPGGDPGWFELGSGAWDDRQRRSWADVERVLRVWPDGMRREAAALDRGRFDELGRALRDRHGWLT